MTFNVLYMHGMLAVNTTVTYLPPPGATLLYANVYDPPMPVKSLAGAAVDGGGSSGKAGPSPGRPLTVVSLARAICS